MKGCVERWSGFRHKSNMDLREAVQALKDGGVVVFPTETSYGIGCDATNAKAVRRVLTLKGRPDGKGTPLIVDSLKMAEQWGVFSPTAKKIAKKYWPGALTLVVPVCGKIASAVLQNKTVALRVSENLIAHALVKGLGKPLVATSANVSGQPPAFSVRAFEQQIPEGADVIIDAGALPKRKPTTLMKVVGDSVEVLRQGAVMPTKVGQKL